MNILDTDTDGHGEQWVRAREQAHLADMTFEAYLCGGEAFVGNRWIEVPESDAILPGRSFDRVTYDLSDWEGISIEFRGYGGEPPTPEETEKLFALGFTVIRIDYADHARWTVQHNFHGDWSCTKGKEPKHGKPCRFGIDQCPTSFSDARGSGPCILLFGHGGPHQHRNKDEP